MKKTFVLVSFVTIVFYSYSFTAEKRNADEPVPYPEGYRNWKHVKSGYRGPESEGFQLFGGLHHIYANELAMQGYAKGVFPEGSILVFDVFSTKEANGTIDEDSRSLIDVMVKDSVKYANTNGWGFERFKGDSKTDRLLNATLRAMCVNCHLKEKNFVKSEYRK